MQQTGQCVRRTCSVERGGCAGRRARIRPPLAQLPASFRTPKLLRMLQHCVDGSPHPRPKPLPQPNPPPPSHLNHNPGCPIFAQLHRAKVGIVQSTTALPKKPSKPTCQPRNPPNPIQISNIHLNKQLPPIPYNKNRHKKPQANRPELFLFNLNQINRILYHQGTQ